MSGAITATTIAAISAAAGVGSMVYGIKSGQDQAAAQGKSLQMQKTSQDQATAAALSTQRKSELAQNAANQKTPDIAGILARAATAAKGGVGSTLLTGSGGVDTSTLNLGKASLLGS